MAQETDINWYPLRVTYSRELPFKEFLDEKLIENFVPMRYEYRIIREEKVRKLIPVIHNLIFVKETRSVLDRIKKEEIRFPIRYIMDPVKNTPLIIPAKQMEDFISVAGSYDEQLIYLSPNEIHLKRGDRVRIIEGPLCGVEGYFLRVKGDRRLVISISGLMAVATAFVHPRSIVKIEDSIH